MTQLLVAYQTRDIEKALDVRCRDRDIDALFATAFDTFVSCMSQDLHNITACTHLIFIAKGLERSGDHVVNAAATVHFLITGQVMTRTVRHMIVKRGPDSRPHPAIYYDCGLVLLALFSGIFRKCMFLYFYRPK